MKGKTVIPTGLFNFVKEAWDDVCIPSTYSDQNISPIFALSSSHAHKSMLHGLMLRDYQIDALLASTCGHGRGVIKMATGSGKTVVIAGLIMLADIPRTLVVVRSKDLLYQTADSLASMLQCPIGKLGDSLREVYFDGITVATVQTLHSLGSKVVREAFKDNVVLIVDECHSVADNKTFDILMSVSGWHRFGTSGTPLNRGTLDGLKLMACTGPVQVDISAADMIDTGWAAKPIIHIHEVPLADEIDRWDWDYHSAYDDCIVGNELRNRMICDLALWELRQDHSVLIIVTRLEHGKTLHDMLGSDVFSLQYVNGSSPVHIRQRALAMLDKQPCVVIATVIFDEGVDVPGLDSVILAAGGASQVKVIQRIGRGLRPKEGRNEVHIHDFMDGDNEYLLNHSEKRLNTYEQEGFDVEVAGCP